MNILEIAIQAEGSVGKLADALGVRQNVISNWRARQLPRSWEMALTLKYGKSAELISTEGAPKNTQGIEPAVQGI